MDSRNCGFCTSCAKGDYDQCPDMLWAQATAAPNAITAGEQFDRFVQLYAEKMRYVDKEGKSTIKCLMGSTDRFRKLFIEANSQI